MLGGSDFCLQHLRVSDVFPSSIRRGESIGQEIQNRHLIIKRTISVIELLAGYAREGLSRAYGVARGNLDFDNALFDVYTM